MPRLLLLIVLINGLAPSLGEAVELVVHYAASGHLAHFEPGEADLGDDAPEHGCGPTAHHCGCCLSQPLLLPVAARSSVSHREFSELVPDIATRVAAGVHESLFRPPIHG